MYRGIYERMNNLWKVLGLREKQTIHFLHIGKTGGVAIYEALKEHQSTRAYIIKLHPHAVKLRDVPIGEKVVFFVRDPISRFVSGFYSRRRKGQPRFDVPWSPAEEAAFSRFATPNELAGVLSSEDEATRASAESAMKGIEHVKSSFWEWFESEAYFLSRLSDILFIGFQERLDRDFAALKEILELPRDLRLPDGDLEAHRNPRDLDTHLDSEAIQNLRKWYASDYAFFELARKLATRYSREPSAS